MTTKRVTNGLDTYASQKTPNKAFYTDTVMRVNAGANGNRAYIYFTRPFPLGVTIISAKLTLTQYQAHSGSTTVGVQRAGSAWSQNTLTWNKQPSLAGSVVNVVKGSTANGTKWEFNLTSDMQAVSNGSPWYGLRIITNSAAQLMFHAMQSGTVAGRPVLEIVWSDAPDQPDNLQPAGGRAVSKTKPTFSFNYNDPSGEDGIQSVQVQVATTSALLTANTPDVWNPGAIAINSASIDSDAQGMSALTNGSTYWWRVRVTDDSGQTSAWSLPESFAVQAKAVLAATVDGGTDMRSQIPTVSWTFTGQTQKHYQIIVLRTDDTLEKVWDSGKLTSSSTAVTLPLGVVKRDDDQFQFVIRVYDNLSRQAGPNDPVYVEQIIDSNVAYDSGTAGVDTLGGASDPVFPYYHLLWTDDTDADWYQVQRRILGETAWTYGSELLDPDEHTTANPDEFSYDDHGAAMYKDFEWRIVPIRAGKQSQTNPATNGRVRRLAPMLMTPDKTKVIAFANAERDRTTGDIQDLVAVLAGPPVLFTQYIGGDQGHLEGILADNFLAGYSGKQMFEWLKWFRKNPGIPLKLFIADESLDVAIYNVEFDTLVDGEGLYYAASFDWVSLA